MITRKPIFKRSELYALEKVLNEGVLSYYRAGDLESQGYVRKLEDSVCEYFNIKYAVAMNSATSCLHVACKSLDVKEVVTTPFTFSASASCILMAGGKVKFSDIEDTYYNIDPDKIEGNTVIAIHLNGHPAELGKIKEGRRVIEDASQSIGAKYKGQYVGTIGDCGVFSFNQWKPISCGEGGILVTNNEDIANFSRLMRNHGEVKSNVLGYNYRMTELQACIAYLQFLKLDTINQIKIELANYLTDKIKDYMDTPKVAENCTHVYYTYPIKVKNRDEVQRKLREKGIYFGNGGLKPLHLFPFYGGKEGDFPVAERMYREMMFTDIIRPGLTFKELDYIAEELKCACGKELVLAKSL
jgi:dTDP-4-amino-4,6-dideoxygalactose transaminase